MPLFTWMGGANTCGQAGIYGVQGIPAPANIPGARRNAVSGTDQSNQLWLFGGYGISASGTTGFLNDLWSYHTVTGEWTWISGDSGINQPNAYGTKGVPATANHPGARQNAVLWVDNDGNIWIFGGEVNTNIFQNDLWKYDVSDNTWTWMSGTNVMNSPGEYGTLGSGASTNYPSARYGAMGWYENGHLWLFGGQGNTVSTRNNDLWKYDISANTWTWVSGSNIPDQAGSYGTMGAGVPSNTPGARQASVTWMENGHLWLFGGYGYPASGAVGYLCDLWQYDLSSGIWTWVWGYTNTSQPGIYGTPGVGAPSNSPGARQMEVAFTDANQNLWMFGGWGYGTPVHFGRLNDLWKYDRGTGNWTWMGGSDATDQPGVYGTMYTSGASNVPGARRMGVSWTDDSGNAWIFGGYGYDHLDTLGLLNDLWKLDPGIPAGMPETASFHITMFPNPASYYLTIDLPEYVDLPIQIDILDALGNKVLSRVLNRSGETIPVSDLSQGLYWVHTWNNEVQTSFPLDIVR